jgi:hypothetical protein
MRGLPLPPQRRDDRRHWTSFGSIAIDDHDVAPMAAITAAEPATIANELT